MDWDMLCGYTWVSLERG